MGYGDFTPVTIGARICQSACCIWGGVVTTTIIVVMMNFLNLSNTQKHAYFDLTISDPASMVVGSFFYYLRAKNNTYTLYSDAKSSYETLKKTLNAFTNAKKRDRKSVV